MIHDKSWHVARARAAKVARIVQAIESAVDGPPTVRLYQIALRLIAADPSALDQIAGRPCSDETRRLVRESLEARGIIVAYARVR